MCEIGEVGAKEVALSCRYFEAYNQMNGAGATSILCDIYDDYSHMCYIEHGASVSVDSATTKSQKSRILNWESKVENLDWTVKDFVKEKTSCPPYLIINAHIKNHISILASAPTFDDAIKYTKDSSTTLTDLHVVTLNDLLSIDEQIANARKKIMSYMDILNNVKEIYPNTCFNQEITADQINNCRLGIDRLRQIMAEMQLDVSEDIKSGLFNASNEYIVTFNIALERANSFVSEEEKRLDEEQTRLDSSTNTREPDDGTNNNVSICAIFGENVTPIIQWVIDLVNISVPVLIIILTIIDFASVVLSGEDKNFKAAGSKLVKRLIIGVIIIFLPMLLTFIIDFSGALVPYGIERNQLFCSLYR